MLVVAFDHHHEPIGQVIAYATSVAVLTTSGEVVEVVDGDVGSFQTPPDITYADFAKHPWMYRVLCASKLHAGHPADLWRAFASSGLTPVRLWAAVKLIEYTGRSIFWRSLRDQILKWASNPPEHRQFNTPLSIRQWDTVLGDAEHVLQGKQLIDQLSNGCDLIPIQVATKSSL